MTNVKSWKGIKPMEDAEMLKCDYEITDNGPAKRKKRKAFAFALCSSLFAPCSLLK